MDNENVIARALPEANPADARLRGNAITKAGLLRPDSIFAGPRNDANLHASFFNRKSKIVNNN